MTLFMGEIPTHDLDGSLEVAYCRACEVLTTSRAPSEVFVVIYFHLESGVIDPESLCLAEV